MSGRLVPFATLLLLFAMLPFLGGSSSQPPTASVVLAAGSHSPVQLAVDAVEQARRGMTASTASRATSAVVPADSAFSTAVGGGLFMFPAISLAPATAEAIAAPLLGHSLFIHPVAGGETSPFGPRIHPLLGRPMFHTGIDLSAACGTPIHAAADGTVIYARISDSWGGRTIIAHTPSLKTAYGHQSKFLVTEGQVVKQGQVIGLSGTTGWSTGCHLHFDVIINDRYVDPAPYLGFAPSATASVPYAVVPHLVIDRGGRVVRTVEDGDVPIPDASEPPATPTSKPTRPTSTPTTSRPSSPSSSPTTRPSTTSSPSTSGPTTTSTTTSTEPPTSTATSTTTAPPASATTTTTPSATTTATTPPTTAPPTSTEPPTSTTPVTPTTTATTTVTPTDTTPADPPASGSSTTPVPLATTTSTAGAEVIETVTQIATATQALASAP